ncbi:hypothetical protein J4G37_41055, partial [Microvirga sp. 3-52]|nr:hypothetical protein [Microvirga sp. 3-52]
IGFRGFSYLKPPKPSLLSHLLFSTIYFGNFIVTLEKNVKRQVEKSGNGIRFMPRNSYKLKEAQQIQSKIGNEVVAVTIK